MKQLISLPIFIFLLVFVSHGQGTRETLTNAKIIEMVRLGLGQALIVAKIERSTCNCDITVAELTKLKNAKVPDSVIAAMIKAADEPTTNSTAAAEGPSAARERTPAAAKVEAPSSSVAALRQIKEPGIYLFEDGEMKGIDASVFSGGKINTLMGTLTYGIKKTSWRAKVRGSSANTQTSNKTPVFYFVFNPEYRESGAQMAGLFWGMPATTPNEFMLVQMNVKQASREAILGQFGAFTGVSMGARDKDVREYGYEKIKPGIYKVVPKTPLAPGEYCFYFASNVTGIGFAGGKIFDFSVR